MTIRRRDALRYAGLGLVAVAGCLDGEPNPGSAGETDDPNGTETDAPDGTETAGPDGTETDGRAGDGELLEYETHPCGVDAGAPDWYRDGEPAGAVTVIDSPDRLEGAVDYLTLPDERRESVTDFLEDVDFAETVVLVVASVGPDTCHDEVAVEDLAVEDGVLTGVATAVGPDDGTMGCGDAVTFPSTLVKATVDGTVPSTAELSITDGWGNEGTIAASADDPLSPAPDELEGYVRPDGDPPAVPADLECESDETGAEGAQRLQGGYDEADLEWGEVTDEDGTPTLALRVSDREVARGDRIGVELTNVSDEQRLTGNASKYNLEVKTDAGWEDVRVATETPLAFTDEAISHHPGEGFSWSFDLTEDGVVADSVHEDRLEVCPGLPAGRYRFVFWEPAVAVAFDLLE